MKQHVIDPENQSKLLRFEVSRQYSKCVSLLSKVLRDTGELTDEDLKYELGAAYLRLSVYQLICRDFEGHHANLRKAKQNLPGPDLMALAAMWLDRSNTNTEELRKYCIGFFDAATLDYRERDSISKSYWDAMVELKKRLSVDL